MIPFAVPATRSRSGPIAATRSRFLEDPFRRPERDPVARPLTLGAGAVAFVVALGLPALVATVGDRSSEADYAAGQLAAIFGLGAAGAVTLGMHNWRTGWRSAGIFLLGAGLIATLVTPVLMASSWTGAPATLPPGAHDALVEQPGPDGLELRHPVLGFSVQLPSGFRRDDSLADTARQASGATELQVAYYFYGRDDGSTAVVTVLPPEGSIAPAQYGSQVVLGIKRTPGVVISDEESIRDGDHAEYRYQGTAGGLPMAGRIVFAELDGAFVPVNVMLTVSGASPDEILKSMRVGR